MTRRRSIRAPDIPEHANPIPAASRIGNLVFSSVILGIDPGSHELPDDREAQIANAFAIVRSCYGPSAHRIRDRGMTSDVTDMVKFSGRFPGMSEVHARLRRREENT